MTTTITGASRRILSEPARKGRPRSESPRRVALLVRDCLAYLRDSRAYPDMYPAERLRDRHSPAAVRMAEGMMR